MISHNHLIALSVTGHTIKSNAFTPSINEQVGQVLITELLFIFIKNISPSFELEFNWLQGPAIVNTSLKVLFCKVNSETNSLGITPSIS